MKTLCAAAGLLLACQFVMTAGADDDMRSIMNNNVYTGPVSPPKIFFRTNGKPLQGWIFASETTTKIMMKVSTDSGSTYPYATVTGSTSTTDESTWGAKTVFAATMTANLPVVVKCSCYCATYGTRDVHFNNKASSDGWVHLKAFDFPGYTNPVLNGGVAVGDGVWLGWEDWMTTHDDYQDMCFILQGVTPFATDGVTTVPVKLPTVTKGIHMVNWVEQNVF
jgi:hypothetical protein